MSKIYTSRFRNPELNNDKHVIVGIVLSMPKFKTKYRIDGNIKELAPPGYLFNEYDRARFTPKYLAAKDKIGWQVIKMQINKYLAIAEGQHKDLVLCCYEDVREPIKYDIVNGEAVNIEYDWCHRLVAAEWLEQYIGYKPIELYDSSTGKKAEKLRKELANRKDSQYNTNMTQLSLFN